MKDDTPPKKTNKRKISEYFVKPEESEDIKPKIEPTEKENEQSTNSPAAVQDVNVQNLKCPKKKVLIGEESDGKPAEKVTDGPMKKRTKMIELGKSQMILDAGQAKIGAITCKTCRMMYSVDDLEDLKTHDKFHEEYLNRFEIPLAHLPFFVDLHSRLNGQFQVHYLASTTPEALKNIIRNHIKDINKEIGYVSEDDLWSGENRILLILWSKNDKAYIRGICVSEKLRIAWTDKTRKEVTDDGHTSDWIVGISRIWVNPSCRKDGAAYSLLDAATTQDRVMEHRARRLRVAFSDPTDDGKLLAQRFMETRYLPEHQFDGEILVY